MENKQYAPLLVIGNLNMDMLIEEKRDKFVKTLSKRKKIGDSYILSPGGNGGNQAVAASRCDVDVILFGKVGQDAFGRQLQESLCNEHVNDVLISECPGVSTGVSIIIAAGGSENEYWDVRGANDYVTREDMESIEDYIKSCKVMIIGLGIPETALIRAMKIAAQYDVMVVFEAYQSKKFSEAELNLIDVLFLDSSEAEVMSGYKVDDFKNARMAACTLFQNGVKEAVIIHIKTKGMLLISNEGFYSIESSDQLPMRDASAMDDTFVGVFSACYVLGKSLNESAEIAYEAACISGSVIGTQKSIPDKETLSALLHGYY